MSVLEYGVGSWALSSPSWMSSTKSARDVARECKRIVCAGLGCSISCEVKSLTVIIQGADDQYGTIRQVEIAQEECYCPVDVTIIAGAGHQPHREAPAATLDAISDFANAVLRADEGFRGRAA